MFHILQLKKFIGDISDGLHACYKNLKKRFLSPILEAIEISNCDSTWNFCLRFKELEIVKLSIEMTSNLECFLYQKEDFGVLKPILKVFPSFHCRLEASFAEHRLWKLSGQWSLPSYSLCHWWQTERKDGGRVSPYEEPVLRTSGKLYGFHHVSAVILQQHLFEWICLMSKPC